MILANVPAFYYGTSILGDLEGSFPTGDEWANFSCTLEGSGAIVEVGANKAPLKPARPAPKLKVSV